MGKTRPDRHRHRQAEPILVPRNTAGVSVTRGMQVFGYDDRDHGGHAEIEFRDVRVRPPTSSALKATASPSPKHGSVRDESTTACAPSSRRTASN